METINSIKIVRHCEGFSPEAILLRACFAMARNDGKTK